VCSSAPRFTTPHSAHVELTHSARWVSCTIAAGYDRRRGVAAAAECARRGGARVPAAAPRCRTHARPGVIQSSLFCTRARLPAQHQGAGRMASAAGAAGCARREWRRRRVGCRARGHELRRHRQCDRGHGRGRPRGRCQAEYPQPVAIAEAAVSLGPGQAPPASARISMARLPCCDRDFYSQSMLNVIKATSIYPSRDGQAVPARATLSYAFIQQVIGRIVSEARSVLRDASTCVVTAQANNADGGWLGRRHWV